MSLMNLGSMDSEGTENGGDAWMFSLDTNRLWLEMTNVSAGLAGLNLRGATNFVYEIFSKTNLIEADWNIEIEIFPSDPDCAPFTIPTLNRNDTLFVWARDWTGITSGGNQTPEWWFWKYFHKTDLADTNLDAGNNTLIYDYTNGLDPNNIQSRPILLATISVTDPVDIKWVSPGNLYVLSGSTATLAEFDAGGNTIRSLSSLGSNPSGFDVDMAGNVYVTVTSSNQVWKFNPTTSSFTADTNFGVNGLIGLTNGLSGTSSNAFNAPFDVVVSPDGGTISVSDSGNNRVQQFSTNGAFTASFGSSGGDVGQFNGPKGLTYDGIGNLYIVDSGNNRIVLANNLAVLGVSGMNGTVLGQFNAPAGVSVNERGIYVADTCNNRIQSFSPLANGAYSFTNSDLRFVLSTNFSQPSAVAAVDNLTNELFYVADTSNNRVLLYQIPGDDPTPAWTNMVAHIATGDISDAISSFSSVSVDKYQQAFVSIGTNDLVSVISLIGALTPVYVRDDQAEYYFTNTIDGQVITFPVEFVKENGVWKIAEF